MKRLVIIIPIKAIRAYNKNAEPFPNNGITIPPRDGPNITPINIAAVK